jgi:tetratricopeptide (TPR) repeat protein
MPTRLLPLLLLLSLACKEDKPAQDKPSQADDKPPTVAPEVAPKADDKKADAPKADDDKPDAPKADAQPAPPTPEQLRAAIKARNGHIAQGRKLATEKKFEEAIAAFEEAVKLDPYDARALSELGWVAFQANKLERADEATRTSLKFTYDPKVRGATLYNLGRIHEARAQLPEAAAAYAQSLALRDNATVTKRLADLTAKGITPPVVAPQQCGFKRHDAATPEGICAAMVTNPERNLCEDGGVQTWKLDHPRITEAASFAIYNDEEMTSYYYLAIKLDGVWQSDQIGYAYNPGAFGVSEEFEIKTLELRPLLPGGQLALYIETRHDHYDSDMGVNEVSTEDRLATYVVGLRGEALDWLFGSVSASSWGRDILLEEEEAAMKEAGITHDTPLPVGESFAATISFKAEEGAVSIAPAADKKLPRGVTVGDVKLLGEAPRCVSFW